MEFGIRCNTSLMDEKYTQYNKCLLELIKRRSKVQKKNMPCEHALNFDKWKTFSRNYQPIYKPMEFDYCLFTNLPRIIVACNFSRFHWNSKEVSYLSWQKKYPNLKTTCHIKLKLFLWTKLEEILLLAKYLIFFTVALYWTLKNQGIIDLLANNT